MNEYSDNFKGVRFPRNLWLDKNISFIEKSILVAIKNLDRGDDHCWATNGYLAEFLQCSVPTVTRAVAHLKEIGYVEEIGEGKSGVCRKLKLKINIEDYPNQNDYTPNQNDEGTLIKMIRGSNQNDEGVSSKGLPNNIYNNIYNNINNNIGAQKNFSNADASPTSGGDVDTVLDSETKKTKRKTKKQQRFDEVLSSLEFNAVLHHGVTGEDIKEIDSLWSEFVEMRCSKDYRAFTDGAVRRNLKVLEGTSPLERKAILEKSVTKGWTGLFPLNDYDKQRLEKTSSSIEGSDEWIIKKVFETSCKEREDELPDGTTHTLLMDLCEKYGEGRIKGLYYDKVKPQVDNRYSIKRDWKS